MRAFPDLAAVAVLVHALIATVAAQKHPHFDDKGTLQWQTTFDAAKAVAKNADRVIFVQYGRQACRSCRALVEQVVPSAGIKTRLAALTVGLAVDCDAPEDPLGDLLREKLPGATMLPFIGFFTCDGQWIDGFSGYKDEAAVIEVLSRVERSTLLDAVPAVRKQLEKAAAAVGPAADKGDWAAVLVAAREARKSWGRCSERTAITTAEKQARAWAAYELDAAVQEAKAGGDLPALRKRLAVVKQKFAGEPEAVDADTGLKALQKLALVREVETTGNAARDLRERHAAPFKDTRWTAVFEKPAPATDKK